MKLSIVSNHPVKKFYLKNLKDKKFDIALDQYQNIPFGWYELVVEYVDTFIEINDILINDASIKHLIYSGYTEDRQGNIHQPSTAVWDKGCKFKIWIHTEIGVLYGRIIEEINGGQLGKNLFEEHIFTVDKPFVTDKIWDESIKSFFRIGDGPHWWRKDDELLPYKILDIGNFDPNEVITELDKICNHRDSYQNNDIQNVIKFKTRFDTSILEISDLPSPLIQNFVRAAGYKRIVNISVHTLEPGRYVWIHRDDDSNNPIYEKYIKGCKQFYWAATGYNNVYYKLGRAGMLPLSKPLLINPSSHPHAVIHQGEKQRRSILIYGELF